MTFADHSKEIRTYKDNRLNGPANIFMANGDRIELIYQVKSLVIFHASFCTCKILATLRQLTIVKDTWIAFVKSGCEKNKKKKVLVASHILFVSVLGW